MNWLSWAIIAGVGFGVQTSLLKYTSRNSSKNLNLTVMFFGASVFLLFKFIENFQIISFPVFIKAFIFSLAINIFAFHLLTAALEKAPLTLVVPFLNLTPLFLFVNAWLILGETTSTFHIFAISMIITGCFIIQTPIWHKTISGYKHIKKGIFMALSVSFLWSISAAYEKVAILNSSVFTYAFLIHFFLGIYFLVFFLFNKTDKGWQIKKNIPIKALVGLAFITALIAYAQYTSLTIQQVSSVIAVKRAGVLISALIGFVYFKERNYLPVITGTVIILAGIFMLG